MGNYSYKEVMYLIPDRIANKYNDFDNAGYDGGLHEAAADYIVELCAEIKELKQKLANASNRGSTPIT